MKFVLSFWTILGQILDQGTVSQNSDRIYDKSFTSYQPDHFPGEVRVWNVLNELVEMSVLLSRLVLHIRATQGREFEPQGVIIPQVAQASTYCIGQARVG